MSRDVHFQMPKVTPFVFIILCTAVIVFLLQLSVQAFWSTNLSLYLGFIPARFFSGYIWQVFTYAFLHGGIFHLLFNLLVIWSMGSELELNWGTKRFVLYYFICVLGAAFSYGLLSLVHVGLGPDAPVVGASGAVYGILTAYGILYGERLLYFFMIFPMPARYFVIVLGAIELVSSIFYTQNGIAHVAHLGGMLSGFLYLVVWSRLRSAKSGSEGGRKKRLKSAKHLKLIRSEEDDAPPKHWH